MAREIPDISTQWEAPDLSTVKEERDVAVTMKPGAQCNKAARTAAAVLGQILRAFHYKYRHTFVDLYKQYKQLHLEFAVQAWSPWTQQDKQALEKVQRMAVCCMVSGL